jgi:acyl-CoA hydrolase
VERIGDGATIQAGIGSVPDAVLAGLAGRRELGVHTELLSDGFVDLVEAGVITGTRKALNKNKIVTTTVLGSSRLHEFAGENPGIELWPVDYTNDPRLIAEQPRMTAINATLEVDFLGQCASESLGTEYWSSSGGQSDYARGAVHSREGQSFTVLHSAAHDGSVSRIVPMLHPGAAITTHKNVVDNVVTEYGVAELRGRPVRERARRLIDIAHPKFRDALGREARKLEHL